MGNWDNKEELKLKAIEHTQLMKEKYPEEIKTSVDGSLYFGPSFLSVPEVLLESMTASEAIEKYAPDGGKVAVLNFASYKNAGGMFMDGSKAQEESLCHDSTLYNVISNPRFEKYYDQNKQKIENNLYRNRAIYSPNVKFIINGKEYDIDVITCAAPNKKAAQKYCGVSDRDNANALFSRCKFVVNIAESQGVNTLILGAFGAGVFGQNACDVAAIFKSLLLYGNFHFSKVIFAIPDENSENFKAFERTLK